MQTELLSTQDPNAFIKAHEILRHGGVVAFPTDTVYGLAADVMNSEAIAGLYQAKDRPPDKAIPVLMSKVDDLAVVAININDTAKRLAEQFWPGAFTMVIPRHPSLPEILGENPTVGVRIPNHQDARKLMDTTGPLAVTSANISGAENTCNAQEVLEQLGGRIDLILDGGITPGGRPSTVLDCTTPKPRILRPGPITMEDIQRALIS